MQGFLFCVIAIGMTNAANISPVQKVIELLEENKVKITNDLAAEEKEMAEYSEFCDKESSEKGYAIETATRKITDLGATIEDCETKIPALEDDVTTLSSDVAAKNKQLYEASEVRKKEKADFDAAEGELVKAVDQLDRAVTIIKRETGAASFAQLSDKAKQASTKGLQTAMKVLSKIIDSDRISIGSRKSLEGLLQTGDFSADSEEQPQAKEVVYESKSGGIIEKIEEMKEKAEETLSQLRMTEMRQSHNFDTFAQSLHDAIKIAQEKMSDAKKNKAESTEATGKAKGELVETEKTKAADEKFLETLTGDCRESEEAWAQRQESAKGELGAISKATEILSEGVRVFMQVGHKSADRGDEDTDFHDDDSDASVQPQDARRQKIVQKLKTLGSKFGSYALMELAGTAASDPFEKIKGLIEQMVTKLINEANSEATQKQFCDEETSKSKASQEDKTMTADKLQSRLEKASSTKVLLEQNVKELEEEIAAIDKGNAEATKLRSEEKNSFAKTSKDFKDAATAVEKAIKVLKAYYDSSLLQTGSAAKIVQKGKQPDFGEAKSDASHAIISILEMSGEDFTRLLMETDTDESEAVKAYEELMQDNRVSKATKQAEIKGSLSEIKSLEVALKNNQEDLDMTNKELSAIDAYLEKLKPQCETKAMSYGEKKARREAEIDGLKEALSILDGSPMLLQKKAQSRLRHGQLQA